MTLLKKQNYYERLEVSPTATTFEICNAYRMALHIYNDESLASYSFFSEKDRKEIIALLEEAFSTLVNEQSRNEYNQSLVRLGLWQEDSQDSKLTKEDMPIPKQYPSITTSGLDVAKRGAERIKNLENILAQEVLTGKDLQKIRMDLGLSLEQIAAQIKVRKGLLTCIEEDQFDQLPSRFHLKSFLTQYIRCLQITDAEEDVVERYLKRIDDPKVS